MPLELRYRATMQTPVEVEGLTPDSARDKSPGEIERFEAFHGNQKLPLAELFAISGDAADSRIDFVGDLAGVHWIGAKMSSGEIHVHGSAGRHLGSGIRDGKITVAGNAGDFVGCEMHRGEIRIRGDAGHAVGGAYPGSRRGMTGGTILIDGSAGDNIGQAMRRGLIAVRGAAGDMAGFNMLAGTILLFGPSGIRHGAGMKRGTIGLFADKTPALLPTFRRACCFEPVVLRMVLTSLKRQGFAVPPRLADASFDLYHGDLLAEGRGEIFGAN